MRVSSLYLTLFAKPHGNRYFGVVVHMVAPVFVQTAGNILKVNSCTYTKFTRTLLCQRTRTNTSISPYTELTLFEGKELFVYFFFHIKMAVLASLLVIAVLFSVVLLSLLMFVVFSLM